LQEGIVHQTLHLVSDLREELPQRLFPLQVWRSVLGSRFPGFSGNAAPSKKI